MIHLDGAGGGPEAVISLMNGLRASGVDQVVFHGGVGRIASACDQLGVSRVQLPIDRKITLVWGFVRLVLALRRLRPDVLLTHGQWAGPVAALAASLAGVKTIYITHWPAFYTDWTPLRAWRNAWAEWIPCRLAARVVALTPSVHSQYLHRGWVGQGKLVQIPNVFSTTGLPTVEDAAAIRRQHGWADDAIHVVSVGRLVAQKKVEWLLEAWTEVERNCPSARLWIIGDGPERTTLERLSQSRGLQGTCTFLGAQPGGIRFMAASDIVVMTSLFESASFVPLEAKACGRPIVASAVDGVRDNVREGVDGYLVPPGDAAALAGRLRELIESSEVRRQMGEAAVAAMSRLDSREIVERYRALAVEATRALSTAL